MTSDLIVSVARCISRLHPAFGFQRSLSILQERSEMLDEYFSLKIDAEGRLRTLPMLLPGYEPPSDALPMLLLGLGVRVRYKEWEREARDMPSSWLIRI